MLLPRGPPEPVPTTTTTTSKPTTTETTPTTPKTTQRTATTPTTTSKTTTSSVASPTATRTATLPEVGYLSPSGLADLVKVATSMTYQWTSDAEVWRYSYEVLGEETVEGVGTWKVKVQFTNEETQDFTVWISQIDGAVKQAEVGGSTVTGEMAGYMEGTLGVLMVPFVAFGGYGWAWQEYWRVPSDIGIVTYQGSETESLGPTSLTVEKFRFDPNPLYEAAKDTKYVEWGFAKLDDLGIATHWKVENKKGEVLIFDLVSVTLAPSVLSG